ncbi:MAG: hypothetical protein Q8N28_02850 [bacterium]|nr:hypothetical protein [bacterium]
MEENLNKQKSSIISAPPEPGITIRTLESDIEDIERGGGEIVARQPVSFEKTKIEANINIPGYTGPEKAIFSSPAVISAEQEQQPGKKTNKLKITGIIIGISAFIAAFGFLGYFVISQWLFKGLD